MDEQTEKELRKLMERNKDFKIQEVVILVIITCLFSFFAGTAFMRMRQNPKQIEEPLPEMSEELKSFVENYQYIIGSYYENVDEESVLDAALATVIEQLGDPHSIYMDEDTYSDMNMTLEGSYSGLGIAISKDNETGYMEIKSVFPGSSADQAGLHEGDRIVSVDGQETQSLTTSQFSEQVLKSTKQDFQLEILRDGKTILVNLSKSGVEIPSVESKVFTKNDKKIGYLYVSIFANNTYKQFKDQLEDLEKQKIDGLIIDVRDNTGGHLTAVSKMIGLFVDSSYIAYQLDQDGTRQKVHSKGDETKEYPIVLLANSYSASASEVLIGSLRDNLGAKLIGEKTYGKGTVQDLITLENGDKYKITTKKWLTPKGTWVNDTKGLIPDIEVTLSDEYRNNPSDETDNQLQKALEEISK